MDLTSGSSWRPRNTTPPQAMFSQKDFCFIHHCEGVRRKSLTPGSWVDPTVLRDVGPRLEERPCRRRCGVVCSAGAQEEKTNEFVSGEGPTGTGKKVDRSGTVGTGQETRGSYPLSRSP